MNRLLTCLVCGFLGIGVAVGSGAARAAEPIREGGLEFVRVTVPPERFRDVPLDGGRLVPMPLADFDRAVAGLLPDAEGRTPRPLADAARYVLAADERGRLSGRLEFDLGATSTAIGTAVTLGALWVERAVLRSDDGVGEAVVFGIPGGRVAVKTPSPGTYACDIASPPARSRGVSSAARGRARDADRPAASRVGMAGGCDPWHRHGGRIARGERPR